MGLPEIVGFARNFAVMVRVKGPDPKGLKMRNHAFHQYNSGTTTISASGMLLPETLYDGEVAKQLCGGGSDWSPALVVTVASVVEPFLSLQHRESLAQGRPELIPGVEIDVMAEDDMSLEKGPPCWFAAQLLTLIDVPASAFALQSLIDASISSPEHGWEVGWSLASHYNPQPVMDVIQTQVNLAVRELRNASLTGKSTTRIAILGVSLLSKDVPNITISPSNKRGDFLVAVGSPFGILSPVHFFNSISVGSIANCYPPNSSYSPLLMADIRCLPGAEGGPVLSENAQLIGMLIRPLRQKTSGAEVQLVISWEAIATACSDLLQKEPHYAEKGIYYDKGNLNAVGKAFLANTNGSNGPITHIQEHLSTSCSPSAVEKAITSVCLITIDDGVWASGVFLNKQGLILTNAHLLEPWRFGKRTASDGSISEAPPLLSDRSLSPEQKIQGFLPGLHKNGDPSVGNEHGALNSSYKGHRNIRVRLDHMDPWVWCDAKVVYVCKGPLDVALLQLQCIPDQLSPVVMDFSSPSLGSKAYVIGHGLFGPRCGFSPSICSGVVAKVVKAKFLLSYQPSQPGNTRGHSPVMLETTAAVHPGGSGGAVVNSDGHMIGLVTSNARHGGGTVIPHLNFSIPCAALLPIFKFSKDMQDLSHLQVLDQPNKHLSSVWALMPHLSPKPPPLPHMQQSLPNDHNKEEKGSRFAKFLAERRDVFSKPTQLNRAGRLLNDIVPSKL
ncbi:glyoxysomal processing protease, glyoxysomal [Rosa rugosa]|uniref:glyoxysomal processing protease, glyoxysomal n=1 Tax=Rosa rugosa TaxID=74645 RepID=UPI002B4013F8|nr:glyoxysomal processing protease, glyoxysomal [Rosa rugosa]